MREMAMKGAQQRMAVQGMAPAPMAQPGSTGGM
jgi:hypothetical protein